MQLSFHQRNDCTISYKGKLPEWKALAIWKNKKFWSLYLFYQKWLITPPWGLQWTGYCEELLHHINTEEDFFPPKPSHWALCLQVLSKSMFGCKSCSRPWHLWLLRPVNNQILQPHRKDWNRTEKKSVTYEFPRSLRNASLVFLLAASNQILLLKPHIKKYHLPFFI